MYVVCTDEAHLPRHKELDTRIPPVRAIDARASVKLKSDKLKDGGRGGGESRFLTSDVC